MLAFFITLSVPVIPFLVRRSYKNEKLSGGEAAIRYLLYLLLSGALTVVFMVGLCDAGTSFLKKVDEIPVFALKYLIVQVFSALIVSGGEWWYETRRLEISVDISGFQKYPPVRFIRRAAPLGIYLLAAAAVLLNVSLIFDNVLWGDEAYSANLIRHTVPEIVQIDALEEPHPPLYYLWLKMWACLLGYSGPVFHLASVLIFVLGVIAALTVFRKRCGKLPAALFVVFTGMSQMCLTYNVEIRMYALAFLGVAFCYYEADSLGVHGVLGADRGIFPLLCTDGRSVHDGAHLSAVHMALRTKELGAFCCGGSAFHCRVRAVAAMSVQGHEQDQGRMVADGLCSPAPRRGDDVRRRQI